MGELNVELIELFMTGTVEVLALFQQPGLSLLSFPFSSFEVLETWYPSSSSLEQDWAARPADRYVWRFDLLFTKRKSACFWLALTRVMGSVGSQSLSSKFHQPKVFYGQWARLRGLVEGTKAEVEKFLLAEGASAIVFDLLEPWCARLRLAKGVATRKTKRPVILGLKVSEAQHASGLIVLSSWN